MTDEYDDEDIILSELPDDELVEQMHDDLYDAAWPTKLPRARRSCWTGAGVLPKCWKRPWLAA